MGHPSTTYVTLFNRPRSSRYQIEVDIPAEIRNHPALVKLGVKPDRRGRIRRSTGRLGYEQARALADAWEKLISDTMLDYLSRHL